MAHLPYQQHALFTKSSEEKILETVVVQLIVDTEGSVRNVEVIEGPELLREESVRPTVFTVSLLFAYYVIE